MFLLGLAGASVFPHSCFLFFIVYPNSFVNWYNYVPGFSVFGLRFTTFFRKLSLLKGFFKVTVGGTTD